MSAFWDTAARIHVIVGHYGSGKTEIALNAAISARETGRAVTLVDLDIVNPFFRSAEQGALLARHGVELIAPDFALTAADIPVLPARVASVFDGTNIVFFDVGGDDAGAAALGRYHYAFERSGYESYLVVNPLRPRSATVDALRELIGRIESRAQIRVTSLINNTNLGAETDASILVSGTRVVRALSEQTGLPVRCVSCESRLAESGLPDLGAPIFAMKRRLLPEWLDT